ncbi:unnamed protein product [Kuraishia capsulata CBS 1993]|uniref:NAD-dependent protein deacylase n=1 Tax=Kuraishia capsulata CBS 1993 TaxID=1382522 RepID=W6MI61_9ASCO|nr:uncharacterized protein KUCA_T00002075001 [Kuraishia capsulata CBS 1993]CDK26104.1 unnamed protein product [Kuraishia capsulata CBS 1993]
MSLTEFIADRSRCKTILALVGAGLSAGSGLDTFRGAGGLWNNYNAMDLATPDAFERDPCLVWQFYAYRRHCALKAKPNSGHKALSQLSRLSLDPESRLSFLTLTQNVDGLSARAGHDKRALLELHGSLFSVKCTSFECAYKNDFNMDDPLVPALSVPDSGDYLPDPSLSPEDLPHCPRCKTGLLRPGVVWFGEPLPFRVIDMADEFIMFKKVDLMLVIGTSLTVWPAAGYVDMVKSRGGRIAIFNTETSSECEWSVEGNAAETLPKALEPLLGMEYLKDDND